MTPPGHASPAPSAADEHRISLQHVDGRVEVGLDGVVLAASDRATLLLEQGCPPRWYLPPEDVRLDLLRRSTTTTVCPFKGEATYWSYEPAGASGADVAWSYETPVAAMAPIRGLVCFYAERTRSTVVTPARETGADARSPAGRRPRKGASTAT
jgi:uncharacterized protein (DUF427 family)